MKKIPVALLGATGLVGLKAIELLQNSPFELTEVAASEEKKNQSLGNFILKAPLDIEAPYIFSALPKEPALAIEPLLTKRGQHVFSNASAFRMEKDVPLLIPEVNLASLAKVKNQKSKGKLICNPNCMVAILAPVLFFLLPFQIKKIHIVTFQSLSGGGKSTLEDLSLRETIIPYIPEEANKIEKELIKILSFSCPITVHVHRVPISFGHSAVVQLEFSNPFQLHEIKQEFLKAKELFKLYDEPQAPQPKHLAPNDFHIHLGQFKKQDSSLSFFAVGHNLVRGAIGGSILNLQAFLESTWAKSV